MTTSPSYITPVDARDHMGLQNYMRCFDDGNSNLTATVDTSTAVATVMRESFVMVTSFLPALYTNYPAGTVGTAQGMNGTPDGIPAILKTAQLAWFSLLAMQRKQEFMMQMGAQPGGPREKSVLGLMDRLQKAQQQIDANDTPSAVAGQVNAGGLSQADGPRIAMSNADGTRNMGDF